MIPETAIQRLKKDLESSDAGVLSIYSNINPALPENRGGAWLKRIKNTLRQLPSLAGNNARNNSLLREVMEYLEQVEPHGRTLACFATREPSGKTRLFHLLLQVDLPVVDLAHGRVDARFGKPYITPLIYAFDEYERAAVLHLARGRWRLYEIFLNEIEEKDEIFGSVNSSEWKQLQEETEAFASKALRQRADDSLDKYYAKQAAWTRRFFEHLAHLLDGAVRQLGVRRLVLMGDDWQTAYFEKFLSHQLQQKIVGHASHPASPTLPSPKEILDAVVPLLEEAERREEMALLEEIKNGAGLWGLDPVLEALCLGRVATWVLPWNCDLDLWRCPDGRLFASSQAAAEQCADAEKAALREEVFDLAQAHGSRLEFVRGPAETELVKELGGMAAKLRW